MESRVPADEDPIPGLTELLVQPDAEPHQPHRLRARHELRTAAYRLRADCERLVEDLHASAGRDDRYQWRLLATDAYVASRALVATVEPTLLQHAAAPADLLDPLLRRILDGCERLLRLVPTSPEDELVHNDAQAIRRTALGVAGAASRLRGETDAVNATDAEVAAPDTLLRARVLVVDDEQMLRDLLRRHLSELGHDVIVAENGRTGLLLAEREQPDLVLTDISMPGLDGITLLRLLKESERTRDIPVVAVSSQADLDSVVQCIELGAEDHLSKPYKGPLLRARVTAALERKRARDAERAQQRRLDLLIQAAEAVERDAYVVGSLPDTVAPTGDGNDSLALLARVFDRVVAGLQSREARLQRRLHELSREVGDSTDEHAVAEDAPESQFAPGDILVGRYEVLAAIGRGGMGMVYHARDREIGEEIALKIVRHDIVRTDPTIVDRLKSEIRLARPATSPFVQCRLASSLEPHQIALTLAPRLARATQCLYRTRGSRVPCRRFDYPLRRRRSVRSTSSPVYTYDMPDSRCFTRVALIAFALGAAACGQEPAIAKDSSSVSATTAPSGTSSAPAVAVDTQQVVLAVKGMYCASCEQTVGALLRRAQGVFGAAVSVDSASATVVFDATKTSAARLIEVVKSLGYDASVKRT